MAKDKKNIKDYFRENFLEHIKLFDSAVSTDNGDWIVKGFIDIAKNIYTISVDTKVVSKIMELLLLPQICRIAEEMGCKMVLCKEQNFYPDMALIEQFIGLKVS
ncbi:MAG: type II restriction endonuclease [Phycisphaerae bacterium]|nr:type II restriction endonuclease [Phycisphaerae bacterium]